MSKTQQKPKPPKTPNLNKMLKVNVQSNMIGEFLEWLQHQGFILGKYVTIDKGKKYEYQRFDPAGITIDALLHKYFKINPKKEEEERRAILDYQRELNKRHEV